MPRVYVLSKVNAANYGAANAYLCSPSIYGDDPGTDELGGLNASASGTAPATDNACVGSFTPDQAASWQNYLAALPGCGSARYADIPPDGFWGEAQLLWGLKIVE